MRCSRRDLELPRGAAHVNEEACISGLRHALECRECGEVVSIPLHVQCVPRALAKGAAGVGAGIAQQKIMDFVAEKLAGKPPTQFDGEGAEGEGPPRRRRRKFDPDES